MTKSVVFGMILTIIAFPRFSEARNLSDRESRAAARNQAQTPTLPARISIARLKSPVKLDGLSNEPAWEGIDPLPLVMFMPHFGKEPSERTEALVAYDDDYLYVAGRLYHRNPLHLQSNSKQRDSGDPSSEWFGIVIDSFNDKENALSFFTTPSGLRWDAEVLNDAQEPDPFNLSWNTFWDVATIRNEEGWFAEMRIPFSSLRFQDNNGRVLMGIIIRRRIAGNAEWDVFPSIPPNWGFYSFFKPSQAQEIVLDGVTSRRPVYVAPYVLGGLGQSFDPFEEHTDAVRADRFEREAGLDVKFGLTSNLTVDLTLNTDFAQVEADDEQINLTRFSLFFPEKRLFFQERSGIFDFSFETGEPNRLFYSRRIGIHDGEIVRIYGGARMVGRVGPWDLGFLSLQTAPLQDLSSENSSVLRLRRRVFNPYSYIGAMTASGIGVDGRTNIGYGLDAIIRVFGDDYLTLKWAQTLASGADNNPFSLKPSRLLFDWTRRSQKKWGYALSFSRAGSEYDPGLGFEMREDFSRLALGVDYGWLPGENSSLFSHRVSFSEYVYIRNPDGVVESARVGVGWEFLTKSGWSGKIEPTLFYENVPKTFLITDLAEMPQGRYTFFELHGEAGTSSARSTHVKGTCDVGTFYDGWRTSLGVEPRWNLSSSLELSGTYELNRVSFSERDQRFTAHIARIRALVMLDTKFSATTFVQYNSAVDAVIGNIRLRYNPREGIDLYLVYNESLNTMRRQDSLIYPLTSNRAILLKYSYTFNL